jgi:hypothetical protein
MNKNGFLSYNGSQSDRDITRPCQDILLKIGIYVLKITSTTVLSIFLNAAARYVIAHLPMR